MASTEAEKARRRRERAAMAGTKVKGVIPIPDPKPDPEILRRLYAEMPKYDTRSLTGIICGDPLPGRRAIDRRSA
jgi:hypothetical protein